MDLRAGLSRGPQHHHHRQNHRENDVLDAIGENPLILPAQLNLEPTKFVILRIFWIKFGDFCKILNL